ncbi:DUF2244 domain-containing protein [Oceanibium sediminis]|uniref:DUF2244 domain-containing protein n=1 Tax=Oceanibium sediminis TaxID=2026339 RepID=UPI000DD4803D|nr:DUF2244 domain-containing protein [Oceanibium sediminis]
MSERKDNHDAAGAQTPAVSSEVAAFARQDPPDLTLTLWPNRSLSRGGFRVVLIIVSIGLAIPLIPFLGTAVGWGLLPFLVLVLVALYAAIQRNYRDGRLHEVVNLWPDLITVERIEPGGTRKRWHANPYWVSLKLHDNARIESYLTLKGNGREIELGAFLSPEERVDLYGELDDALRRISIRPTPD